MLNELLRFSKDQNKVYIVLSVKTDQIVYKFEKKHIEQWLNENGASDFFCFDSAIGTALLILNKAAVNDNSNEEDLLIAEKRDATLSVHVAEDKMKAFLHFKGAYGGREINGNEILIALKAAGVIRGVKKRTLQRAFAKATKLKSGEELEVLVALGKPAINGQDGKLEYLVADSKDRILRPQERGDGTVDMRDLGKLLVVAPGRPLAKTIGATKGVDGVTVTGEVLASEQGKELVLQTYAGSSVDENNANLIIADISGIVTLHYDGVEVTSVLCFDSISVATGHVNFTGSVIINNDVEAGMRVDATGSVAVGGSVESAIIQSGGDVIVQNGILGRQPEENESLSCIIKAKGVVVAKFAQYSQISANDSITITHNAAYCNTLTKSDLIVCDQNERNGILNGGNHIVHGRVKVVIMGTSSETITHVEACAGINDIQSEIHKLYMQLNDLIEVLQKIKSLGMKLTELPIGKRPEALSSKLILRKYQCEAQIEKLRVEIRNAHNKMKEYFSSHDIKILKFCHSGLHCRFGDLQKHITHDHTRCRLYSDDETIHLESF